MQVEFEKEEKVDTSIIRRDSEKKFIFPTHNIDFVLDLLRHDCLPDRRYPENDIYTIYYDTEDFDAYYEKINGDIIKAKLRVRWYDDDSHSRNDFLTAFVEIKFKDGLMIRKARSQINLPGISFINDLFEVDSLWGDYIRRASIELGWSDDKNVHPVILIKYKRSRFIDAVSGAQIAVDRQISVEKVNTHLLPMAEQIRLDAAVLEVKGGERLPKIINAVKGISFSLESFSKYANCLQNCASRHFL